MKIKELITTFEKLTGETITQSVLAETWCLTEAAISKRVKSNLEITVDELIKACRRYDISPCSVLGGKEKDSVEIKYYENPKVKSIIRHSKIHNIWKDREVVHEIWNKDEKDLRVIKMFGDCMRTGEGDSINPGDVLIIDITSTNPLASGIYAFLSGGQDCIFIARLKKNIDGSITFMYKNNDYDSHTRTKKELEENEFQIIGKVIHNESKLI